MLLNSFKVISVYLFKIIIAFNQMSLITKRQLSLRNGVDKPEIWIAFNGKVYDVTLSRLWFKGKHYEHWAGQDLTDELKYAPHTDKVFERYPCVGELAD